MNVILWKGEKGCPVWREISSIRSFSPPDAGTITTPSPPRSWQPKMPLDIAKYPWRCNLLLVGNHWNREINSPMITWNFSLFTKKLSCLSFLSLPRIFLLIFERERGKHWYERETSISCLPHASLLGIEPATQVWALTRNRNYLTFVVYGTMLQPTEPPGQGSLLFFKDIP